MLDIKAKYKYTQSSIYHNYRIWDHLNHGTCTSQCRRQMLMQIVCALPEFDEENINSHFEYY